MKCLSSVQVVKQFGIVDRGARNFTGVVTKVSARQLSILKHKNGHKWNVGTVMYLPVIYNTKQHVAVAKLVGKKCKVSCMLDGVPVEALWDTGAQVSIVSKGWRGENRLC